MSEHAPLKPLVKAPTGISGLDDVLTGGVPDGRPTLLCGSAGSGKTLMAMDFLVHGATALGEPGVFMAFEENATDLAQNVASLGIDLAGLIADRRIMVDHVHVAPDEILGTGDYDLSGLLIRLEQAIDELGAKRVVLDTIETLYASLPNPTALRAELARLFRWIKNKGVTALITAERGESGLTRHGLEEYVSDCVILLDHRVDEQVSTRRLRVVKYRGSTHGTNEYPFLIDADGIFVLPVTSLGLNYEASRERISTGVPRLDTMLGGEGYYRGSSVLISGTAGTGKSTIAARFAEAACSRGERALYFTFEESQSQVARNMASVGIDFAAAMDGGLLRIIATRPAIYGLEMHLATMLKEIEAFEPAVVVADPLNAFVSGENIVDVKAMWMRLVDYLKGKGITALFTTLTSGDQLEQTETQISSLIDTWLLLRDIEIGGERNRGIYVLKSRGMGHSNQIREFLLSDQGVELADVYVGPGGVLTGSARLAQEASESAARLARQQDIERRRRELERKRQRRDARIAELMADFEAEENELRLLLGEAEARESRLAEGREEMGKLRQADEEPAS